jgi:hypothetical protein
MKEVAEAITENSRAGKIIQQSHLFPDLKFQTGVARVTQ